MTGMSINGQSRLEYPVPNNLVGLIIGKVKLSILC